MPEVADSEISLSSVKFFKKVYFPSSDFTVKIPYISLNSGRNKNNNQQQKSL